jgi:hypothetical protein
MSNQNCQSCVACDKTSVVGSLQNQVVDTLNRTTYLSAPYSIGAPLASIVPSPAIAVAPVQGPAVGFGSAAPNILGAPAPLASIAPGLGVSSSLLPSVSSGYGLVSQTPGFGGYGNAPLQHLGINSVSAPFGNAAPVQNVLSGTPTFGSKPIQKTPAPVADPKMVVGPDSGMPSSSRKNLMSATGNKIEDTNSYSDAVGDSMDYIPETRTGYGAVPITAPTPIGVAPGIALGGVGGIAVTTPAFLGGTPNVGVAAGIAFANECGSAYGVNAPAAVLGTIAPSTQVLGSNYLNNLASIPYYSGLNSSEPAAVMNSAHPAFPGYAMLIRNWQGCPTVIISKPDRFGCPTFETICPFEDHGVDCNCEKCNCFEITNCDYVNINGFSQPNIESLSLLGNLEPYGDRTFLFLLTKTTYQNKSYPLLERNESGLALAVNGIINRNILMYKNCTYNILFHKDNSLDGFPETDISFNNAKLIFTIDPCGFDCSGGPPSGFAWPAYEDSYIEAAGGLVVNLDSSKSFRPTSDIFPCCLTTIYYQIKCLSFTGGPITIL